MQKNILQYLRLIRKKIHLITRVHNNIIKDTNIQKDKLQVNRTFFASFTEIVVQQITQKQ